MKFGKPKESPSHYTPEEIERRQQEIPRTDNLPASHKRSSSILNFSDTSDLLKLDKVAKKPIPASIEYLSEKRDGLSKLTLVPTPEGPKISDNFIDKGSTIARSIKQNFIQELDETPEFQFEKTDKKDDLKNLFKTPEAPQSEFAFGYLAEPEKVKQLTELHMKLYSVLSKIQETSIASDFRLAYDIQDRISYILDNETLLSRDLVDEIIVYLKDIVLKLEKYKREIHQKQLRFIEFNNKVSKLKEYKYKTDNSFKMLEENKIIAEQEIEKNLKAINSNS